MTTVTFDEPEPVMSNRDELIRRIHSRLTEASAANPAFNLREAWCDALARCGLPMAEAVALANGADPMEALLHHAGTRHGFATLAIEDAIRLQANRAA
jgi:phosphoglycolate phosphatase-like HAD superfamily hydrolase